MLAKGLGGQHFAKALPQPKTGASPPPPRFSKRNDRVLPISVNHVLSHGHQAATWVWLMGGRARPPLARTAGGMGSSTASLAGVGGGGGKWGRWAGARIGVPCGAGPGRGRWAAGHMQAGGVARVEAGRRRQGGGKGGTLWSLWSGEGGRAGGQRVGLVGSGGQGLGGGGYGRITQTCPQTGGFAPLSKKGGERGIPPLKMGGNRRPPAGRSRAVDHQFGGGGLSVMALGEFGHRHGNMHHHSTVLAFSRWGQTACPRGHRSS